MFTDDDRQTTERVALVNRAFVRQYYPDRDPLTGAFYYGYPKVDRTNVTRIAGVIDDVRFKSLALPDESTYYLPVAQGGFPLIRATIVIAQPGNGPDALIAPLRDALTRFDPQLVVKFTTQEAIVAKTTERQQRGMTLMLAFGAMALALAAIGIYGVIAYAVEQRRTELATRLALGASSGLVFRMLLKRRPEARDWRRRDWPGGRVRRRPRRRQLLLRDAGRRSARAHRRWCAGSDGCDGGDRDSGDPREPGRSRSGPARGLSSPIAWSYDGRHTVSVPQALL
jgi:hypothetical protein